MTSLRTNSAVTDTDPEPKPRERRGSRTRRFLWRIRAWMIVLPVDALMLLSPILWAPDEYVAALATMALSLFFIVDRGRYHARLHVSVLDELPSLLASLLTAAAIVATAIVLLPDQVPVSVYIRNAAIAIGLVIVGRIITSQLIIFSRRRRLSHHRTVIIGGGPTAAELIRILKEHHRYGLSVVGFVEDTDDCAAGPVAERLGNIADLDFVVARRRVSVLLVADSATPERTLVEEVRAPASSKCDLLVVPRMHQFRTESGGSDHIGSIPIMRIGNPRLRGPALAIKRFFDILVSGTALILVSPILAICALAVRIDGGPGVIFRQPRVGRNGELFDCLKLRSMRPATSAESATNWSIATDNRVSKVGRFLRRTSLDELPQLWNILRGDMSLVGPRPERPHFVEQFSDKYDRYAYRHRVQVGLTGLAQVSGLRGDTSIADRARYDNYYIENWSLWLDVKIIIRTFFEVVFARGR
jgi:exopolysaccharide biosynthesis polyprenyl glycosylphosphotransferase